MQNINLAYTNYALIQVGDKTYPNWNILQESKTKTLTHFVAGKTFKLQILTKDIKISPKTYWKIGQYDHQFESEDANCWLCEWYGLADSKCKCPDHFEISDHVENLNKARKNFLLTYCKNYFAEKVDQISNLNDEQIYSILFSVKKGELQQNVYFPNSIFTRTQEIETVNNHIRKMLEKL